jgi:hypothetical protein
MRSGRIARGFAPMVVLVVVLAVAGCRPTASFYVVPEQLPPNPGDVIHTQSVRFDGQLNGIRALAVMYRSTTAAGAPNAVTGTLLVPEAPWAGPGSRPIVAFGPGTQGVGDRCAPTRTYNDGSNYEIATLHAFLDQGWAVAATDYEKLGTPGNPTYLVKDAAAHALLDIVRAAQRLPGSGVSPDAPVGLWGYSQGGQAAGGAAEMEATYAPELNIAGAVIGGVPADGLAVAANLDSDGPGNDFFSFLAFTAVGYDSAYPELDLPSYLNDEGRAVLAQGTEGPGVCLTDGLALLRGRHIAELTTTNPLDTPRWQARIAQQDLGSSAPTVPVFQFHGTTDQVIPIAVGEALRDAWCAGGSPLTYSTYPADHITGVYVGTADGVDYLTARFAGDPPVSTCPA